MNTEYLSVYMYDWQVLHAGTVYMGEISSYFRKGGE